ncbi:MAG: DUF1905 domain-containing protein [Bacteroidetes bacterium]|nr:MAG: DUF1905 domain-containing protein [Bacteroidota bacterium]
MSRKFDYQTVLIRGPQKGVFAEFPFDGVKEFGTRKAIPVRILIEGKEVEMSLLPCGNGKHWLHIKKELRTAIGKDEGDTVNISLEKNNSIKSIEIPEYLQWLLENDVQIMKKFLKLPYSAKKFWIWHIEEPKNEDTKVERINRFFDYLNENYSG